MKDFICIAGKNQIATNATTYLLENLRIKRENLLAITNATDTGENSWQPSFKKFALDNGIKIITLKDAYEIENLVFISLEFDKIIKPKAFKTKRLFNMHFSLLPAYKGMHTAVLPLLNGESRGGVSFHCIDEGIDTGDIVGQRAYEIALGDTAMDVYFKNLEHSFLLFKELIEGVLSGEIKASKQACVGASYYSKAAIDFKNIRIDFNKTSFEIYNQLRAFIFPPYQLPKIDGKEIYKCVLSDEKISTRKMAFDSHFIISGIDGFKITAHILTNGGGGGNLTLTRFAYFTRFIYFTAARFTLTRQVSARFWDFTKSRKFHAQFHALDSRTKFRIDSQIINVCLDFCKILMESRKFHADSPITANAINSTNQHKVA